MSSVEYQPPASDATADTSGVAGHPRGLTTLFFTEMWERFSFYGMKAILVLYTTAAISMGGLQFSADRAGRIIALYTSSVYFTPLVGGWLADRVFGTRLAVLIGGIVIACGHFSMAMHSLLNFYAGLILIALGTGLLKPNISTMVGQLYPPGDVRRDAGFSIFYMGINLGALVAPLVCGFLAQSETFKAFLGRHGFDPNSGWHWGFGAAGVGMVLGLTQYVLSGDRLKGIGKRPEKSAEYQRTGVGDADPSKAAGVLNYDAPTSEDDSGGFDVAALLLAIGGAAAALVICLACGERGITSLLFPTVLGGAFGYVGAVCRHLAAGEIGRVIVIFILFVFSAVFWMSFEQAGTSLNLFADRLTRTNVLGHEFPSSWFQSVQPAFVILLAPVFAGLWVWLGRRNPSSPAKFAFGLLFAGLAFAVVAYAATLTRFGKVSPMWLIAVYFLQTLGELCLSPVGLSTITKVAPTRLVGLMMGVWFLSTSLGDYIAARVLKFFDESAQTQALVHMFSVVAIITFVAAAVLLILTPFIKRMIPRGT